MRAGKFEWIDHNHFGRGVAYDDLECGIRSRPQVRPRENTRAIDSFRGQHFELAEGRIATELGRANFTVDESESPLAWRTRRRGRKGRVLIEPHSVAGR
jgi:hypothetical protein